MNLQAADVTIRSDHDKDTKITEKLLTDSLTAVHCSEEELISKKKEVSWLKNEYDKTDWQNLE